MNNSNVENMKYDFSEVRKNLKDLSNRIVNFSHESNSNLKEILSVIEGIRCNFEEKKNKYEFNINLKIKALNDVGAKEKAIIKLNEFISFIESMEQIEYRYINDYLNTQLGNLNFSIKKESDYAK